MSSKTLNKRQKLRVVKKTKKTKKRVRKYLGGGKYSNDTNFNHAYREIYNIDPPDDAVYWLKEVQKRTPADEDISNLIQKLEMSSNLLKDGRKDIERINDM